MTFSPAVVFTLELNGFDSIQIQMSFKTGFAFQVVITFCDFASGKFTFELEYTAAVQYDGGGIAPSADLLQQRLSF